ncbi:hypothetical protein Pcac1_g25355 [Phytophthora cactorum]|nr:hypothetical protein Pcac1_g25355 [Phytophthora cactorum]
MQHAAQSIGSISTSSAAPIVPGIVDAAQRAAVAIDTKAPKAAKAGKTSKASKVPRAGNSPTVCQSAGSVASAPMVSTPTSSTQSTSCAAATSGITTASAPAPAPDPDASSHLCLATAVAVTTVTSGPSIPVLPQLMLPAARLVRTLDPWTDFGARDRYSARARSRCEHGGRWSGVGNPT